MSYEVEINGKTVDLIEEVFKVYGKRKIGAAAYLSSTYGIKMKDANAIMEKFYADNSSLVPPSFLQQAKNDFIKRADSIKMEDQERKDKKAELDAEGTAYCPKCLSTSLTAQKKGFGFGKAAAGAVTVGGLGLLVGGIGSKKIEVTCLKCGHKFTSGK